MPIIQKLINQEQVMIVKIKNNKNIEEILSYLKKDISKCLYLYIDIKKYGISDNLKVWKVVDSNQMIRMVIMKYYSGLQVFSEFNNFPLYEVVEFLNYINYKMISGEKTTIDILKAALGGGYITEYGHIQQLKNSNAEDVSNTFFKIELPEDGDFLDIAKLICSDDDIGSSYEVIELKDQLLNRRNTHFGKNLVVKSEGKIIGHIATYAELENIAVIGGVIVDTKYRNMGIAKIMTVGMCKVLEKENKDIYLFVYKDFVRKFYRKLGFEDVCECGKIVKTI